MTRTFDTLPFEEQNRVRAVARTAVDEGMAHVARELQRAMAPLPTEGPITLDAEWLYDFAAKFQDPRRRVDQGSTDYIFERAFRALDHSR